MNRIPLSVGLSRYHFNIIGNYSIFASLRTDGWDRCQVYAYIAPVDTLFAQWIGHLLPGSLRTTPTCCEGLLSIICVKTM